MDSTDRIPYEITRCEGTSSGTELLYAAREMIDAKITAAVSKGTAKPKTAERMRRLVRSGTADSVERVARWVDVLDSREQAVAAS